MAKTPAQLWVEALKSGEYKQGKGTLCRLTENGPEHCCLGVLCEVYQKEVGGLVVNDRYVERWYGDCLSIPPVVVIDWVGKYLFTGTPFAAMNDVDGLSFIEIANIIEERENDHRNRIEKASRAVVS